MYGYIDNVNFHELETEKYWSFPKTYKGNKKEETKYMITSGDYYGSLKRDGHYARFIKDEDGNMMLQGRTKSVSGDYLNKIDWVPQCKSFFDSLPNGTCLLGELYFPNQKGSRKVTTILGCSLDKALQRQESGEKVCYYVFDIWAYDGKSLLNKAMNERVDCFINTILPKYLFTASTALTASSIPFSFITREKVHKRSGSSFGISLLHLIGENTDKCPYFIALN